jgi:hypothetical protein
MFEALSIKIDECGLAAEPARSHWVELATFRLHSWLSVAERHGRALLNVFPGLEAALGA